MTGDTLIERDNYGSGKSGVPDPSLAYGDYVGKLEQERKSAYGSVKIATFALFLSTIIPIAYGAFNIIINRNIDMMELTVSLLPVTALVRFEVFAARRHHNILKLREAYGNAYAISRAAMGFSAYLPPDKSTKSIMATLDYLLHYDPESKISVRPGGDIMSMFTSTPAEESVSGSKRGHDSSASQHFTHQEPTPETAK